MTERDAMLAGLPYDPADPDLVQARLRARRLCAQVAALAPDDPAHRAALRELFAAGGDTVGVAGPFHCDYGSNIELGEKVFFNFDCVVLDVCRVTIGAFTLFGPAAQVYTALHPMDAAARRSKEHGRPVRIGSDVWVGGGALILPGVSVGDRAVIGAGSVVTRDVPPDVFAAGNPCRVVRPIG